MENLSCTQLAYMIACNHWGVINSYLCQWDDFKIFIHNFALDGLLGRNK